MADAIMEAGFPGDSVVKNLPVNAGDMGLIPGQEDPLEKEIATTIVFLPGKSRGQRSLVGYYSPWGHKKVDTTQWLNNKNNIHGSCQITRSAGWAVKLKTVELTFSSLSSQRPENQESRYYGSFLKGSILKTQEELGFS